MAVALDTLSAVKRLRSVRFDEDQAEVVAELLREREQMAFEKLATKDDLHRLEAALRAEVRGEIGSLESRLGGKMNSLEARLGGELNSLEARLGGEMSSLESRLRAAIADSQTGMIKWFTGVMLAQGLGIVVATVTITKLLAGAP